MRPLFNQRRFEYTADQEFETVIRACQREKRKGQAGGTWISEEIVRSYCELHLQGYAHSVEVWQGRELVGGLYGISLGKVFFGESMFSRVSNASKAGLITLVRRLEHLGFWLIDCQQETEHLQRLGARSISRKRFLDYMRENQREETLRGNWSGLVL